MVGGFQKTRKIIRDAQEIVNHKKINNHIFSIYYITNSGTKTICEAELTEREICGSLMRMENNKSPDNDGLTKEFYCTFWNEIQISS